MGGPAGGNIGGTIGGRAGGPAGSIAANFAGGIMGGVVGGADGGPDGGTDNSADGSADGGPEGGADGGADGGPGGGAEGGAVGGTDGGASGGAVGIGVVGAAFSGSVGECCGAGARLSNCQSSSCGAAWAGGLDMASPGFDWGGGGGADAGSFGFCGVVSLSPRASSHLSLSPSKAWSQSSSSEDCLDFCAGFFESVSLPLPELTVVSSAAFSTRARALASRSFHARSSSNFVKSFLM